MSIVVNSLIEVKALLLNEKERTILSLFEGEVNIKKIRLAKFLVKRIDILHQNFEEFNEDEMITNMIAYGRSIGLPCCLWFSDYDRSPCLTVKNIHFVLCGNTKDKNTLLRQAILSLIMYYCAKNKVEITIKDCYFYKNLILDIYDVKY